ncbi:MAG: FG-GAP-like repeat-containing protein [Candidatus Eisenbacteria bacterium]|nr:FG-GAP-like repeat-containing protein [Candidatus Eisenbacteria bacterium]
MSHRTLSRRRSVRPTLPTLLLGGLLLVPPASAARRLFADPVQVIPQPTSPAHILAHTFPGGVRRLLITSVHRQVQILDPTGANPWQPLSVVEMDGDPSDNNTSYHSRLLLADVNEDQIDDMILDGRPIFVAPGRPDGTYAAPFSWEMPGEGRELFVQDVDGDGHVDLVRPNYGNRLVIVRAGRGDGRFNPVAYGISVPSESFLLAADMTSDGLIDLLRIGGDRDSLFLVRYVADGAGGFERTVTSPLSSDIDQVVGLGRMDGDDEPDLVTAEYTYDYTLPDTIPSPFPIPRAGMFSLSVHPGLGDGHFADPLESVASERADYWMLFDLDGDGRLDVIAHDDGHLWMHRNGGDGTLEPRVDLAMTTGSGVPHFQDFDGDGRDDILVTGPGSLRLVTRADIDRFPVPPTLEVPFENDRPLLVDLDGDGRLDLVGVGQPYREGVTVFTRPGLSGGSFGAIRTMTFPQIPERPSNLRAVDLDGDGDLDLFGTSGFLESTAVIFENDGSAGFTAGPPMPLGHRAQFNRLVGVDGDGMNELLSGSSRYVFGESDSTFLNILRVSTTGPVTQLWRVAIAGRLEGFLPADVDNDGRSELIAWSGFYRESGLRILHRREGFSYQAGPLEPLPDYPDYILPGDWLPEPGLELVVSGFRYLSIMARDAGGAWTIRQILSDRSPGRTESIPDMNGDGRAELSLHGSSSSSPLTLYLSNDVTGFADGIEVPFASSGGISTLADIDADGQPDLIYYESDTRLAIRYGLPVVSRPAVALTALADDWSVILDWTLSNPPAGEAEIWRVPVGTTTELEVRLDPVAPVTTAGQFTDSSIRTAGRYRYRLVHRDPDGYGQTLGAIEVEVQPDPGPLRLLSVRASPGPGPFRLTYEVRATTRAMLEIFAVTGRRIVTHDLGILPPSRGEVEWNGRGDDGRPVASGIYFARLARTSRALRLVVLR